VTIQPRLWRNFWFYSKVGKIPPKSAGGNIACSRLQTILPKSTECFILLQSWQEAILSAVSCRQYCLSQLQTIVCLRQPKSAANNIAYRLSPPATMREKEVSLQEIRSGFEFVPWFFGIVLRGGYLYGASSKVGCIVTLYSKIKDLKTKADFRGK